tara:strand:+ start:832 stop:969 length:138 start_codon:yes stop_codon:yes gene_type:complete
MNYEKSLEFRVMIYKKAYHLLMDYYDFIPEEDKPIVHKKLKELGL